MDLRSITLNDEKTVRFPPKYVEVLQASKALDFKMASDVLTGNFLRTLAVTKPKGRFLEIGTGTGLSATWILNGMDSQSTLLSVDNNPELISVAKQFLDFDTRLTLQVADGGEFIKSLAGQTFDFIFADSWPGKYNTFEETLRLVAPGGFYVVDDMLSQPNWPEGHQQLVDELNVKLDSLKDFRVCKMDWSTGLVVCTRKMEVMLKSK
jgi:predicted O-methyltransferase YrrM